MLRWTVVGLILLGACGSSAVAPPAGTKACTPGVHQTCNLLATISALWGTCRADGTCACNAGFEVAADSGLCRPADAGAGSCGDATCAASDFCMQRNHGRDGGLGPYTWQCSPYLRGCTTGTCECALQSFISASCLSPTCVSAAPVLVRCTDLN